MMMPYFSAHLTPAKVACAQAIGKAIFGQGYRVIHREAMACTGNRGSRSPRDLQRTHGSVGHRAAAAHRSRGCASSGPQQQKLLAIVMRSYPRARSLVLPLPSATES